MTQQNPRPGASTPPARPKGGLFSQVTGIRYLDPRQWVAGAGYERGAVLGTAWRQAREAWRIKGASEIRHEQFADAMLRLGLTEAGLAERRAELSGSSRACYLAAAAVLLLSGYHAVQGNLAGGIGGLAMTLVVFYCGFLRAFRAWQVDIRRFASFKEFLLTPEAWFL